MNTKALPLVFCINTLVILSNAAASITLIVAPVSMVILKEF